MRKLVLAFWLFSTLCSPLSALSTPECLYEPATACPETSNHTPTITTTTTTTARIQKAGPDCQKETQKQSPLECRTTSPVAHSCEGLQKSSFTLDESAEACPKTSNSSYTTTTKKDECHTASPVARICKGSSDSAAKLNKSTEACPENSNYTRTTTTRTGKPAASIQKDASCNTGTQKQPPLECHTTLTVAHNCEGWSESPANLDKSAAAYPDHSNYTRTTTTRTETTAASIQKAVPDNTGTQKQPPLEFRTSSSVSLNESARAHPKNSNYTKSTTTTTPPPPPPPRIQSAALDRHHQRETPKEPPPRFNTSAALVFRDAQALIRRTRAAQDRILFHMHPTNATFSNAILPLEQIWNEFLLDANVFALYEKVAVQPSLRRASSGVEKILQEFAAETDSRQDLLRVAEAVFQQGNSGLDPESWHLLQRRHDSFVSNGFALSTDSERQWLKQIRGDIQDLEKQFQRNLVNANGEYTDVGRSFHINELTGVTNDILDQWGLDRLKRVWIPYTDYAYSTICATAHSGMTRKIVFLGYHNRCTQSVPLLRAALVRRHEAANLLGYENHAALRLEPRLAKSPAAVIDFLTDLHNRLRARGDSELEALKAMKKQDLDLNRVKPAENFYTNDTAERLYFWDSQFYLDMMNREPDYMDMQQQVATYFPLQATVDGLLSICQDLFGLAFSKHPCIGTELHESGEERLGGARPLPCWEKDIHAYSVWEDAPGDSVFVGYLYLDLYARPGKPTGSASVNIQPGFVRANGLRQYPSTALIYNLIKPEPKVPSLLTHRDVAVLFHEMGHCIHDLVSKTKYAVNHGSSSASVDFVNAPSQLLEKWAWSWCTLKKLSHHYSYFSEDYFHYWRKDAKGADHKGFRPSKEIPDELLTKLLCTKQRFSAISILPQVQMSMFDMAVHHPITIQWIQELDISQFWTLQSMNVTHLDGPELAQGEKPYHWSNGEVSIPNYMAAGLDASYYGPLYSNILASDIFYTFFNDNVLSVEAGRRLRKELLEKGTSISERKIIDAYMGRSVKMDGLYKDMDIA